MKDELSDLRRDYLADVQATVIRIRKESRDLQDRFKQSFPELLFLAHQLKGSGGSLGFPRITELARRMRDELILFLDEKEVIRPTPDELSESLVALSNELEREVNAEEQTLKYTPARAGQASSDRNADRKSV